MAGRKKSKVEETNDITNASYSSESSFKNLPDDKRLKMEPYIGSDIRNEIKNHINTPVKTSIKPIHNPFHHPKNKQKRSGVHPHHHYMLIVVVLILLLILSMIIALLLITYEDESETLNPLKGISILPKNSSEYAKKPGIGLASITTASVKDN
ncbi:MAG: hypothetical protein WC867_03610 [Candidatus Pacearchaeota archaeon]|jgi:hypothetical protein